VAIRGSLRRATRRQSAGRLLIAPAYSADAQA